jgi:hypothetical protein
MRTGRSREQTKQRAKVLLERVQVRESRDRSAGKRAESRDAQSREVLQRIA